MAVRINDFLLLQVLFLSALLILPLSSGIVNEDFKDGIDPIHLLHKNGVRIYSRKLWRLDAEVHDYDDAGPNPKHDPRRKPGSGRNP